MLGSVLDVTGSFAAQSGPSYNDTASGEGGSTITIAGAPSNASTMDIGGASGIVGIGDFDDDGPSDLLVQHVATGDKAPA